MRAWLPRVDSSPYFAVPRPGFQTRDMSAVRYDVRGAQPSLSYDPTQFGKYLDTLTTPRFMQFALRFAF
jgi:hypothetical protein